jgi:HSP20 family protein
MNMPMRRGTTQHWIPSIFNDFFDNNWMVRTNTTAPAINVLENEKEYTIEVAAPGMTKSDFKIQMDADNDLTITMEKGCNCCCNKEAQKEEQHETAKQANNEEPKGRYLRREFSYTKFQQTLVLPDDIEASKIEAKVTDGVLCIKIPKKNKPEEKSISKNITIN